MNAATRAAAYELVAPALINSAAEGFPFDLNRPSIQVAIELSEADDELGEFIDNEGPGGLLFLAAGIEKFRDERLGEEFDAELDEFLASAKGAA